MEAMVPSGINVNQEKPILCLNSYKLSKVMKCNGTCCRHTDSSGLAFSHTGKMCCENKQWPFSCHGTNFLTFFSPRSHLIAAQDWPQLHVSSPTSVFERSRGTLQKACCLPQSHKQDFCTGFPCHLSLAAVGLFTWSMEIPHLQPASWAGCRVLVCLQGASPRGPHNFSAMPCWLSQLLSVRRSVLKCLSLCFASHPCSSHNLEEDKEELGSMPQKSMEDKTGW